MRIIKVNEQIPELVERFNAIMGTVQKYVVNRDGELAALKLCLLTKQHLLLEGEPGIAKSRFALLAFRAFNDAYVYQNMFHGQTTTDEVVGPPNTKILREKGTLVYNTEGMLPQAEFAYLDELFNGPGAVLNSALNILNERKFLSGGKSVNCPLLTAVATTNEVSDGKDLRALVDRFLIMRKVLPADSESARQRVIRAFLAAEDIDAIKFPETMTLRELGVLQAAVRQVKVPDVFCAMMESARTSYATSSGAYISDRRFCWAYRAVQAAILIACEGRMVENPPMDTLVCLADVFSRKAGDHSVIENNIVQQFQMFERQAQEETELNDLEDKLVTRINSYDESASTSRKRALYAKLNGVLGKLKALSPDQQYTIPRNVERLTGLIRRTEECVLQIEQDLGIRDSSGMEVNPDLSTIAESPTYLGATS